MTTAARARGKFALVFVLRLGPNAGNAARLAMARDSPVGFKRAEFKLVEMHNFPAAAVVAFEKHARHGFRGISNRGKFDSPKIHRGIYYLDPVEEAFLLPSKLADDSRIAAPV